MRVCIEASALIGEKRFAKSAREQQERKQLSSIMKLHKLSTLLALSSLLVAGLLVYTRIANTFQITSGDDHDNEQSTEHKENSETTSGLLFNLRNYSFFAASPATSGEQSAAPSSNESSNEVVTAKTTTTTVSHQVRPADFEYDELYPEGKTISEALRRHYERDPILRHLTSKKLDEMPALKSSFNEEDEKHLEASHNYFYKLDELHQKHRVSDFGLMALTSKAQSMVYSDIYNHRYDLFQDLRLAAGPSVDQEKCISQLSALNERADVQAREQYHSKDINLFQLLDTWAHMQSGLLIGNAFNEGMYHECLRLKIRTPEGERWPTRYCVLSVKHNDWPKIDRYDILSIKGGVCLPKACDSSNYKNKFKLIMNLLMKQLRPLEQNQIKFSGLYCLPDEDSPLRSIRNSPLASCTLIGLIAWLSLLAYCTYKHHKLCHNNVEDDEKSLSSTSSGSKFGLTNMNAGETDDAGESKRTPGSTNNNSYFKMYEMLSITNNFKLLFSTQKESSLIKTSDKLKSRVAPSDATEQRPRAAKIIDLSCIEGIKVIAMTYVISGHVLMCITTLMQNGREMAGNQSIAFFLANLVPAFAVNAFFTITGTLTCYLMFKQNQSFPFMMSPGKWAAIVIYRYLRIMPMYALAVLYCKSLAKYTGSGPLWDYATSSIGQRRACEQEPWSVTLLFRSNFTPPLEHCIPGGWYLSNDFQFFLVTPLFLALLDQRPRLGQLVLYGATLAGYVGGFWSIYAAPVMDLKPIAMFAPHGFKTYISHFSYNYTQPQYRIPAYLIGLIIGHNLFTFERAKLDYQAKKQRESEVAQGESKVAQGESEVKQQEPEVTQQEPDWSDAFKRYSIPVCIVLVISCCITPVIGSQLPFTLSSARFMVSFITPSYHIMFALAVGIYLLLATTGYGNQHLNRFLSASAWKPLARLSLCAVLVNVEVINYIIQSNSNLHYVTNQFHASLNLICILATYVVSIFVCVLFEAPIRAALNTLLTYAIKRVSVKRKMSRSSERAS